MDTCGSCFCDSGLVHYLNNSNSFVVYLWNEFSCFVNIDSYMSIGDIFSHYIISFTK